MSRIATPEVPSLEKIRPVAAIDPATGFLASSMEPKIANAIRTINYDYGVRVLLKPKTLLKFGRNSNLGTTVAQVWLTGGNETLPTTNAIDTLVSTDASDDQPLVVEGHTVDGSGNLTFVTQAVTINGTTPVTLSTPLARCTMAYNNTTTLDDNFAGTVTIYQSGNATVHLTLDPAVCQQSFKCATSISQNDYWIITQILCSVRRNNDSVCDFQLSVRRQNNVWRPIFPVMTVSRSAGTQVIDLDPCLIVPANADVKMMAVASSASTQVSAWVNGYLATVQE